MSSSAAPSYPAPSPSDPSPEQQKHLPALPPLFLAPPFTPSHSVFRHVSSVASEVSSKLREEAEEYLAKVVRDKVAELEAAENNLRAEVEAIWAQWKQAISKAEQEANEKKRNRNNNRQSGNFSGPTSPTSPGQGNGLPASVRITSFVPQGSPNRSTTSASVSRTTTSALSASLATSTFHHPKALAERNGSTSGTASANGSRTSPQRQGTSTEPTTPSTQRARSPATASSRTLAMNIPTEAVSIREAYRRNMDESKDIATSFKYVMEMDQLAGQAALVDDASLIPVNTVPSVEDVPRGRSPKSAIKRVSIGEPSGSGTNSQQADVSKNENGKLEEKKPEAKIKEDAAPTVDSPSKGKRKVTFVVNPDVTIIDDEPTRESETKKDASVGEEGKVLPILRSSQVSNQRCSAAVFDFENESGEREGDIIDPLDHRNVNTSEPTTPIEPIQAPRRPPRVKKTDMSGLPSSLSTLRPASLPMPSTMRPAIPEDRHSEKKLELTPTSVDTVRDEKVDHALEDSSAEDPDEEMDSREAEILKLVAAHTPSHRSAWKKNSKAWQLFVSRQGKKKRKAVDRIPEEDEDSTSSRAGYYDESDETTESDDKQRRFTLLVCPFLVLIVSQRIPLCHWLLRHPYPSHPSGRVVTLEYIHIKPKPPFLIDPECLCQHSVGLLPRCVKRRMRNVTVCVQLILVLLTSRTRMRKMMTMMIWI